MSTTTQADNTESRVGQMLANRYRLERLIAKGGMGRVYLATQLPLERKVAIKLLIAKAYDEEFRKRFFLEASTCAKLVHRHIVTVHDYGEADNGELFMAMEYLDGEPLSKIISREIRLSSERACKIALQTCRALRTAHKTGIVHRDLKPGNIMLLRDEDHETGDFIKVLDFGLVKAFEKDDGAVMDLTRSGTWLGSPRYMAPEQIRCKGVDPRTDIYSLGVILFHMIAGRPPFVGANSVEILEQHLRDPVPSIRDVVGQVSYAPELEVIIQRCMEKDQEDRYQSMDDLIADLKAAYRLLSGVSMNTEAAGSVVNEPIDPISESGVRLNTPLPRGQSQGLLSRPPTVPQLGAAPDLTGGGGTGDLSQSGSRSGQHLSGSGVAPFAENVGTTSQAGINSQVGMQSQTGVYSQAGNISQIGTVSQMGPVPQQGSGMKWAMAVLFLLILGIGAFVVFGNQTKPEPKPEVAVVAPDIDLRIETDPSGAEVLTPGGEVLGTTPLKRAYPASNKGSEMVLLLRLEGYEEKRVRVRLGGSEEPMQVKLKVLPPKPVVKEDDGKGDNKPAVSRRARRRWRPTRTSNPEPQGEASGDSAKEPTDVVKAEPAKKPAPKPVVVDEGSGSGLVVDDDPVSTVDNSDGLIVE